MSWSSKEQSISGGGFHRVKTGDYSHFESGRSIVVLHHFFLFSFSHHFGWCVFCYFISVVCSFTTILGVCFFRRVKIGWEGKLGGWWHSPHFSRISFRRFSSLVWTTILAHFFRSFFARLHLLSGWIGMGRWVYLGSTTQFPYFLFLAFSHWTIKELMSNWVVSDIIVR